MWLLLLSACVLSVATHPIEENPTTASPVDYPTEVNAVFYIQGFKAAMTEYVTSQYKNFTIRETEQVKDILETFLLNFAKDLRETVEKQLKNEPGAEDLNPNITKIEDGIPDETFNDINVRVRSEFPDITEGMASDIVYNLRKNLFETRQKLDMIIRKSQKAQIDLEVD